MIRRLRALLQLAGLFAGSLLLTAWLTVEFMSQSAKTVEVPDLVGRSLTEAIPLAQGRELHLAIDRERIEPEKGSGEVLEQEPKAGLKVREGAWVRVTVNRFSSGFSYPDVRGLSQVTAEQLLKGAGVQKILSFGAGRVVAQEVVDGAQLQGSTAALLLMGEERKELYVMPDLKGISVNVAVQDALGHGIFVREIRYAKAAGAAPDAVLDHSPAAGFLIETGDSLVLTVNPGDARGAAGRRYPDRIQFIPYRASYGLFPRRVRLEREEWLLDNRFTIVTDEVELRPSQDTVLAIALPPEGKRFSRELRFRITETPQFGSGL